MQKSAFALVVAGILVLLNILAGPLGLRFDLTRDKSYTLSEATRETLDGLENPVKITAYFTSDMPAQLVDLSRATHDLLEEYRVSSHGNLSYEFIDPVALESSEDKEKKKDVKVDIFGREVREKTSVEKELEELGVQPVNARIRLDDSGGKQQKMLYLALLVRYGEEKEVIPAVSPEELPTLEYDITTIIRNMTRKKPVVGVTKGHGELEVNPKLWEDVKRNYDIRDLNLTADSATIDDEYDAIIVIGPKQAFGDAEQKAIDDFLMKGKAAAFFIDRANVDLQSFQPAPVDVGGLDQLISAYGVEVGSQLVGDVSSGTVQMQVPGKSFLGMPVMSQVPYPYLVMVPALSGDTPLSKGVNGVMLPFTAALYPKTPDGVEVKTLAKSTSKSWIEDGSAEQIDPRRDWNNAEIALTGPYNLIVQARGTLPSAKSEGKKSDKESRVVVVGSSMWLNDKLLSPGNVGLFMNMIDWLALDSKLLDMRQRGLSDPPFDPELTDGTKLLTKVGNVVGVPLLLCLYGLFRWQRRSSKKRALTPA